MKKKPKKNQKQKNLYVFLHGQFPSKQLTLFLYIIKAILLKKRKKILHQSFSISSCFPVVILHRIIFRLSAISQGH